MKITTLDGNIIPVFSHYPDGQPHVKIDGLDSIPFCTVECSIRNPQELFNLGMVLEILDNKQILTDVLIHWLFGARMDRRIDDTTPSTFDVVLNQLMALMDSYNVKRRKVLDVHNYESLLETSIKTYPGEDFMQAAIQDFGGDCDIFFPDKGAAARYSQLATFSLFNKLIGGKDRDSATGRISNFRIESGERQSDSVLIVDDICSGGWTFAGQAKVLQALGYKRLGLYTTHGIYSGDSSILACFDAIYSTNSFQFGTPGNEDLRLVKRKVISKLEIVG